MNRCRDSMQSAAITGFTAGIMDCKIGYMDAAFADLDENGNCINITIYSGPGMAPEHYYSERYPREVVDVTEIVEEILDPEEHENPKVFRRYILGKIKEKIENQLSKT